MVFLDRDGVLNVEIGDYITRAEDFRLIEGSAEAVARLTQAGWTIFVFTNQAGVGRGRMSNEALQQIHTLLQSEIEKAGGVITAIYACLHHPDDGCECRKPKPGLLKQASMEHQVDLNTAVVIGDSPRDIEAGFTVGAKTILVLTGKTSMYNPEAFPAAQPDNIFLNLSDAAAWLLTAS